MIFYSRFLRASRTLFMILPLFLAACGGGASGTTDLAQLGQMIFTDRNLSEPRGTSCASCHQATMGFAGNHGSRIGVALGSQPDSPRFPDRRRLGESA